MSSGSGFTKVPQGFFRRALGVMSLPAAWVCGLARENTVGKPRKKGSPAPREWQTNESELGTILLMSPAGVRRVLREAESCLKARELGEGGVLGLRRTSRGFALRFDDQAWRRVPAKPLRERRRLPNAEERAERRRVQAMRARFDCPAGVPACPVQVVYVNGRVTNTVPLGAEVIPLSEESDRYSSSDQGGRTKGDRYDEPKDDRPETGEPSSATGMSELAENAGRREGDGDRQFSSDHPEPSFVAYRAPTPSPKAVQSVIRSVLGRPVDLEVCGYVAAKLDGAPLGAYRAVLVSRRREIVSDGFLPYLAEDAAKEHAAGLERARELLYRRWRQVGCQATDFARDSTARVLLEEYPGLRADVAKWESDLERERSP